MDENGQQVAFIVTNDNPGLFSAAPAISPEGTLTYTPAFDSSGLANVTVRLQDDGGTANGGVDTSAPQTFSIRVVLFNDAPVFTLVTNVVTALEDKAFRLDNFATNISPGSSNETTQKVSFVVASVDPSFFLVQPAISASGTLTFTPAKDVNGENIVTIVLEDNGGTAFGANNRSPMRYLIVRVTPVNDAPSFAKGPNQTIYEDSLPQTILRWATNIKTGPTNEFWQEVTFVVTNSNPGLFTSERQPAITPTGTLTYAPRPTPMERRQSRFD